VIVTILAVTLYSAGSAQDLSQSLKEWVLQNIVLSPTHDGKRSALIRRLPVKADLRTDESLLIAQAKLAVSSFSDAFGLQFEFTPDRPNLIIVVGSEINDGDKPRRTFLTGLGLPEAAVNMIVQTSNWSSGCGYYNFVGRKGDISATVIAGDRRLAADRLKDCIISGIAFGFGARARPTATFDTSQGYIQYLLLSRSMAACDMKFGESFDVSFQDEYVACVVGQLKNNGTAK